MKNYKYNDNLRSITIGDTLTLEDGSVHEAIADDVSTCTGCSLFEYDCKVTCRFFVFKQIKP